MPVFFTHPRSDVKATCISLAVEPLRELQALAWMRLVPLVAAGREGGAVRAERRAEGSAGELGRGGHLPLGVLGANKSHGQPGADADHGEGARCIRVTNAPPSKGPRSSSRNTCGAGCQLSSYPLEGGKRSAPVLVPSP